MNNYNERTGYVLSKRNLKFVTLIFLSWFIVACGGVSIEAPAEGSLQTSPPDVIISYKSQPSSVNVKLNGYNIGDKFVLGETEGRAPGAELVSYLREGKNRLRVGGSTVPREFVYDAEGPVVHITSVEERGGLHISGYLEDPVGARQLKINGSKTNLGDNGEFSDSISDRTIITFEAIDNLGRTRITSYRRPGIEVNQALSVRINPQGIDPLEEVVEDIATELDLTPILEDINPIIDGSEDRSTGCIALIGCAAINAESAQFDTPSVDLQITDQVADSFSIDVSIPNLVAQIDGRAWNALLSIGFSGEAKVDMIQVQGDIEVSIQGDEIFAQANNLNVELADPVMRFNGLLSVFNGLIPLFERFYTPFVERLAETIISDRITEVVNVTLDHLATDVDLEVAGVTIQMSADPETLGTQDNGLDLSLGLLIEADESEAIKPALGSVDFSGELPDAPQEGPEGETFEFGAMLSTTALNQAFMAVYQAGLEINMTASGVALGVPTDELSDKSLLLTVKLGSPPAITPVKSPFGVGEVSIDDGELQIYGRIRGEQKLLFSATFNADIVGNIDVTRDNFIDIQLNQEPFIDLLSVKSYGLIKIGQQTIENAMRNGLPLVLPLLGNMVDIVPMPSLYGYTIDPSVIWVPDADEPFIAIGGSLRKVR